MKALEIIDLHVKYVLDDEVICALNGINLSIEKGKTLGLVGETGAGKTTTARSILNLIPDPPGIIESGTILVNDIDVLNLSEEEMEKVRGNDISMIFQDPMTSLNPVLTVEDQIAESFELHKNLKHEDALIEAGRMLETVGIPKNRGIEYPHQFSGGMKQRVVIAMALACNPKLLIADEPTTALDVTIQAQVLLLMKKLKSEYNTSILMITHDLGVVANMCDEVSIIYAGRIFEHGSIEDVFLDTKHPYTQGLFNSLPNIKKRGQKLKPIKGLMSDPSNLPEGCTFHPRCEFAMDICKQKKPAVIYAANNKHFVECHLYSEANINQININDIKVNENK